MRTLKFRVYIPEHEKFCYFDIGNFDYSDRYLEQDKYPVQQFTGLLDKNGKEIYEGDIVKGLFLDTDIHHWEQATVPVVWVDRVAGFNLSSDTWDRLSIEVAGNIFDRRIQESIKMAERLKDREKPNLDEVDFGTPHWKEE